jgi:hypothetical protein
MALLPAKVVHSCKKRGFKGREVKLHHRLVSHKKIIDARQVGVCIFYAFIIYCYGTGTEINSWLISHPAPKVKIPHPVS